MSISSLAIEHLLLAFFSCFMLGSLSYDLYTHRQNRLSHWAAYLWPGAQSRTSLLGILILSTYPIRDLGEVRGLVESLGAFLAMLLVGSYVVPRMIQRSRVLTIPQMMGALYGPKVHLLTGITLFSYLLHEGGAAYRQAGYLLPSVSAFYLFVFLLLLTLSGALGTHTTTLSRLYSLILLALVSIAIYYMPTQMWPLRALAQWPHNPWVHLGLWAKGLLVLPPASSEALLISKEKPKLSKAWEKSAFLLVAISLLATTYSYLMGVYGYQHAGLEGIIQLSYACLCLHRAGCYLVTDLLPFLKQMELSQKRNAIRLSKVLLLVFLFVLVSLTPHPAGWLFACVKWWGVGAFFLFAAFLQAPLLAGVMGLKVEASLFYRTTTVHAPIALGIAWLSHAYGGDFPTLLYGCLPLTSALCLSLLHYRTHGGFAFVKRSFQEEEYLRKHYIPWSHFRRSLWHKLPLPGHLAGYSQAKMAYYGTEHLLFGLFFGVLYLLPLWMWPVVMPQGVEKSYFLSLRFVAFLLCAGLLTPRFWPRRAAYYLASYWHATLCFCLVFYPQVFFLALGGEHFWLTNIAISTLLLTRLVDGVTFGWLSLIGSLCTLFFARYTGMYTSFLARPEHFTMGLLFGYTYLLSGWVGLVFLRKKKEEISLTVRHLNALAKKVLHEVSNTVGISKSHGSIITMCLNTMEEIPHEQTQEDYLYLRVPRPQYELIKEQLDELDKSATLGQQVIRNILKPLKKDIDWRHFDYYSVAACLRDALEMYQIERNPFAELNTEIQEDITFLGSAHQLSYGILNLLKNSYEAGYKACKVNIKISKNRLYFEDNGPGIAREHMPYLFTPFYTTRKGIGMGLYHLEKVMKAIGGSVRCESSTVPGKSFARFILTFPEQESQGKAFF